MSQDSVNFLVYVSYFTLALDAYLAPGWVAWIRERPNKLSILIINLFLGWTFIGWIICLAWSLAGIKAKPETKPT